MNIGDEVSIKGNAHSKVTVVEIGEGDYARGKVRVQNSFQSGAQGEWMDARKLVPYGADTGTEAPMNTPVNPDKGNSGPWTHHQFGRRGHRT